MFVSSPTITVTIVTTATTTCVSVINYEPGRGQLYAKPHVRPILLLRRISTVARTGRRTKQASCVEDLW